MRAPAHISLLKPNESLNILLIWWPRNPSTGQNLKQYSTGFILVHCTQGTDAMFVDSFTQWKKAINPANKKRPPRWSSNFSAPLESDRARTACRHMLWSSNFKFTVWIMRGRCGRDSVSSSVCLFSDFYFRVLKAVVVFFFLCKKIIPWFNLIWL